MNCKLLMICILIGLIPRAEEPPEDLSRQVIIQWDNDLFSGTDRDYTNGARIGFLQDFHDNKKFGPVIRRALGYQEGEGPDRFSWGIGATQLMFTPEDHRAKQSPKGDRPYAGWLGIEGSFHAKSTLSASSLTLSIGTTGKRSYARETQNWVHRNISDSPLFQGWESQIPDEITLNLFIDQKRRIMQLEKLNLHPFELDGYIEFGTALGNFRTDAYVGTLLRGGYNLPAAYIAPRVQIGSYRHAFSQKNSSPEKPFSCFAFAAVRGSAVVHDITLDGPVFRDFDTDVESKPLVGELLFGLSARYRICEFIITRTVRTDEFNGQKAKHQYDSVQIRCMLTF